MASPCDFDRTNKKSCKQKNVFRAICYEYTGPNSPYNVLRYNSS